MWQVKIYRTTKYHGDKMVDVRYRPTRHQWAAIKGSWYRGGYIRLVLEVAEIPDDAWVKVEEA